MGRGYNAGSKFFANPILDSEVANTLVITVEGARADLLGAYGADNAVTPRLDRLAAKGIVLDRLFVDSLEPLEHLASMWTATHRVSRQSNGGEVQRSIWRSAEGESLPSALITDCPQAAELAEQMGCRSVTLLAAAATDAQECEEAVAAEDPLECALVTPFLVASEGILSGELSGLVWIHSRGLRLPWDAPLELRDRFRDPEDPSPPSSTVPPAIDITRDTDPDAVVGWGQVAAAQTAVLDEAVSLVMDATQSGDEHHRWNCVFAGIGGVPIGEHGVIGWHGWGLHETHLACAAILLPQNLVDDAPPIGQRRAEICQLPDLAQTIAALALTKDDLQNGWSVNLLGAFDSFEMRKLVAPLDHAVVECSEANPTETWVRTAAWSGKFRADESALYFMPDDRWEACDVASRRYNVCDQLQQLHEDFARAAARSDRSQVGVVDEELYNLMR
ncbi:MAG: hypothetical protein Aurels2KO_49460 [Aureliella sp.]